VGANDGSALVNGGNLKDTPRYWFPKRYADLVQRLRVAGGFVLLCAFAWLARPSLPSIIVGLPVSLVGLLLRGWAAGHLAKDKTLAVSGPYASVRNPLYVGTLVVAFGIVLAARNLWLALLFAAVFLLVYLPAVELEEQHLREIFEDYPNYARRVNRFWPRPGVITATTRFSWSLYRRNEEYKAALGWLIAVAWLAWRYWRAISVR
jgi:protein-S-isoprenylcysteine O-methyltransferase Ste14